jgi:hypothetical protein
MRVLAANPPLGPTARAVFRVGAVLGMIAFGLLLWFGFRVYDKSRLRPWHRIMALVGIALMVFGWVSFLQLSLDGTYPSTPLNQREIHNTADSE